MIAAADAGAAGSTPAAQSSFAHERRDRVIVAIALLLITLLAALLRIEFLDQPMRYDESVTYLEYVRPAKSIASITQTYRPNNHLFHTLLVCLSVRCFGDSPTAVRLPALLAGIAIVPLAYLSFAELSNRSTGLLAAALSTGSAPLVFYSANARGYSLLAALTLIALWCATRTLRSPARWPWIVLSGSIALGMWTVPVMIFPAAGIFAWMLIERVTSRDHWNRRVWLARFAICVAVSIGLTLLLYLPTIRAVGVREITSNKFVQSHGVARFARDLRATPTTLAKTWMADLPWPIAWFIHGGAFASIVLARRWSRRRVPLLAIMIAGAFAVLCATLRVPPTRVWIWLLAIYLGCAGGTMAVLLHVALRHRERLKTPIASLAACIVAVTFCFCVHRGSSIRESNDTGSFPDAPAAAALLEQHLRSDDRLIASTPADGPLMYYLARAGIDPTVVNGDAATAGRVFIVLGRVSDEFDSESDATIEQLAAHRRVNLDRYNPPQLLRHFATGDVYAASRKRGRMSAD